MAAVWSKWAYCLDVPTAMSVLNQLDRQLLGAVLEPLRRQFALSDIELDPLVAQHLGWRATFFAAGRLTVRAGPRASARRAVVAETCRPLWGDPVLRHVCSGAVLTATVGYGALARPG